MNNEDVHLLELIDTNKIGTTNFSRISIASKIHSLVDVENIMKEILFLLTKVHKKPMTILYASSSESKLVYLITCQFKDQSLTNIFLDFTSKNSFRKFVEVSGTTGLYQYDSNQTRFYESAFLKKEYCVTNLQKKKLHSSTIQYYYECIQLSITEKKEIHIGEDNL